MGTQASPHLPLAPGPYHPHHSMGSGAATSLLPSSIAVPLKRSWFASRSSKPFSLPFKKRRFVVIASDDDDDDDDEPQQGERGLELDLENRRDDGSIARRSPGSLSILATAAFARTGSLDAKRAGGVATPTPSSTTNNGACPGGGYGGLAACITPVPATRGDKLRLRMRREGARDATHHEDSTTAPSLVGLPSPNEDQHVDNGNNKDNNNNQNNNDKNNDESISPLPQESAASETATPSPAASEPSDKAVALQSKRTKRRAKRSVSLELETPLPTGCHATTSRTQSYCRRGPNFNGSNYCKLHYFDPRYYHCNSNSNSDTNNNDSDNSSEPSVQPHAGDGTNESQQSGGTPPTVSISKSSDESSCDTIKTETRDTPLLLPSGGKHPSKEDEANTNTTNDTKTIGNKHPPPATSKRSKSKHHRKRVPRDKLYRGCTSDSDHDSEVRCLATSTRGKRCCYSAVASNGDKYCHRHSSFYVPPSPASGETTKIESSKDDNSSGADGAAAAAAAVSKGALQEDEEEPRGRPESRSSSASSGDDQPPAHPRSPTALSDLSTDLWQNRKVRVAKGPHKSRIGTVAKWRNGWVTVELGLHEQQQQQQQHQQPNTSEVCYHNRRSYELFLV